MPTIIDIPGTRMPEIYAEGNYECLARCHFRVMLINCQSFAHAAARGGINEYTRGTIDGKRSPGADSWPTNHIIVSDALAHIVNYIEESGGKYGGDGAKIAAILRQEGFVEKGVRAVEEKLGVAKQEVAPTAPTAPPPSPPG